MNLGGIMAFFMGFVLFLNLIRYTSSIIIYLYNSRIIVHIIKR